MLKRIYLASFIVLSVVLFGAACNSQTASPTATPISATTTRPAATNSPSPTAQPTDTQPSATPTVQPQATQPAATVTAAAPGQLPNFRHVFTIIMENEEATRIVGNPSAAYINSLAGQYATASNYYGVSHPSLPNYLALTGGDTFKISTDCTDCFVAADNIVNQLEAAGRSWKAYMESMPNPCFVGDAPPLYRQKHNPFIYYDNVRTDPARCNNIVPFTQFATDLQAKALPDYVWITPNMCNDMHDCSIAEGDAWLQKVVPQILASPAWQDNGVLFITFDEGDSQDGCCTVAHGGKVETLVISPLAQRGFTSAVPYDHYSLLRTIEQAWNLPLLAKAGCDCTTPLSDFFTTEAARP